MKRLLVALFLVAAGCGDSATIAADLVFLDGGGFSVRDVTAIAVELRPQVPVTQTDGTIRWRDDPESAPLLTNPDERGRVVFEWDRRQPYVLFVAAPTAQDSHCVWLGSVRVLDSAAESTIELGVACE